MDLRAAGFALAQRIAGVLCTPQLFEDSDFHVADDPVVEVFAGVVDTDTYTAPINFSVRGHRR